MVVLFTGWKDDDFQNLVDIRAAVYRLRVHETGRRINPSELIPVDLLTELGLDLPIVSRTNERIAAIVTLAEDGPGPAPEHGLWDYFTDLDGVIRDRISHAAASRFHRLWQSRLDARAVRAFQRTGDLRPLQERSLRRYQHFVNAGYESGMALQEQGRLPIYSPEMPIEVALGLFVDNFARVSYRGWLAEIGLPEGSTPAIRVNRRLYDPNGEGAYRVPDIHVGTLMLDATIGYKGPGNAQIVDFATFGRPSAIAVVRPWRDRGGSYLLTVPPQGR